MRKPVPFAAALLAIAVHAGAAPPATEPARPAGDTPKAERPKGDPAKPDAPKGEPATNPRPEPVPQPPPAQPAVPQPVEERSQAEGGRDLRDILGVNPGIKRVEVPRLPTITLQGFVRARGQPAVAVLELKELKRVYVVRVGTEIPLTVSGRLAPPARSELLGLDASAKPASAPAAGGPDQTQVLLKVVKITREGVVVEAGVLAQTIFIR